MKGFPLETGSPGCPSLVLSRLVWQPKSSKTEFCSAANHFLRKGIPIIMKTNRLVIALMFGSAMAWSPAVALSKPQDDSTAKKDAQKAGKETKDATKNAGQATKKESEKAYNNTKNGTQKAYEKSKEGTKDAYHSTEKGTEKAYDKSKEGTKDAYHSTEKGTKKAWDKTKDATTGNDTKKPQ
jgi:hypothetical protein